MTRVVAKREPGGVVLNPFLPLEESGVVRPGFSLLQRGNKSSLPASDGEIIRGQQQEKEEVNLVR